MLIDKYRVAFFGTYNDFMVGLNDKNEDFLFATNIVKCKGSVYDKPKIKLDNKFILTSSHYSKYQKWLRENINNLPVQ